MILELSKAIARQLGHNYVGSEHMLFALLRERECLANRFAGAERRFRRLEQSIWEWRNQPGRCRRRNGCRGAMEIRPSWISLDGIWTQAARNGELDPVIGRAKEIERIH